MKKSTKIKGKYTKGIKVASIVLLVLGLGFSVFFVTQKYIYNKPAEASEACTKRTEGYTRCKPSTVLQVVQTCSYNKTKKAYEWGAPTTLCRSNEYCEDYKPVASGQAACQAIVPGMEVLGGPCQGNGRLTCSDDERMRLKCVSGKWTAYSSDGKPAACKEDYKCIYMMGSVNCYVIVPHSPDPSKTPTPTYSNACKSPNFCATRFECSQDGSGTTTGTCGSGMVCCKPK